MTPSPSTKKSGWLSWLATPSAILLLAATVGVWWCSLQGGEKPGAVLVWGHWLDLTWEVFLPMAVLGMGGLSTTALARRSARKEWTQGGDIHR